jgi:ribonuclease Y
LARRGGLLHDIGKVTEGGAEGTHPDLGREMARKYGEPPEVLECVGLHHTDLDDVSPVVALVQAADTLSASRPGAPSEALEKYMVRLKKLEALVESFDGVVKAYAIRAGSEVRVLVDHDQVDDLRAVQLSSEIARRIQIEMEYPGQIKVTVLRETRAVEYAK